MSFPAIAHRLPTLSDVLLTEHPQIVGRLSKDMKIDFAEADLLLRDVKTFLYLAAITGKSLTPPRFIDEGWHQFILFTEDYAEFCNQQLGRFMHHRPGGVGGVSGVDVIDLAKAVIGTELSKNWYGHRADCTPAGNCESAPSDCALNINNTVSCDSSNCSAGPNDCYSMS